MRIAAKVPEPSEMFYFDRSVESLLGVECAMASYRPARAMRFPEAATGTGHALRHENYHNSIPTQRPGSGAEWPRGATRGGHGTEWDAESP